MFITMIKSITLILLTQICKKQNKKKIVKEDNLSHKGI